MNLNEVISHVLGPRQFDRVCKAVDQVANTLALRSTDWVVDLAVCAGGCAGRLGGGFGRGPMARLVRSLSGVSRCVFGENEGMIRPQA
jgi:hypothetical protein